MNKLKEFEAKLPKEIDAFLVCSGINRRYFTNFSSTAGALLITKEKSYLFLDFRYIEMAQKSVKDVELVFFSEFYEDFNNFLEEKGVKKLAIETEHTSIKKYEEYKENIKNVKFVCDENLDKEVLSFRSKKTEEEINKIKLSQEVTDAAFSYILEFIAQGRTEKEVAFEIESFILKNAEANSFPAIVVSGKNSSLPHGRPSSKKLEKGDLVTMDFGAVLDGYCSDMTRTVCVGAPSSFQKELYSTVLNAQEIGLKTIKEGLICKDVDAKVREYFKQFNYVEEFGHGLGHGVGLEIHEDPYLNKICDIKLEKNMVVTVEPGLYLKDKMGIRIEDMVVVKEDGILNLTKSSKEFICV